MTLPMMAGVDENEWPSLPSAKSAESGSNSGGKQPYTIRARKAVKTAALDFGSPGVLTLQDEEKEEKYEEETTDTGSSASDTESTCSSGWASADEKYEEETTDMG